MAAIAFDAARRKEPVREPLKPARSVLREMLDAFVSYRMRSAASAAGHIRPRRRLRASSTSIEAR
jgi:hypothetical protein